MANYSVNCSGLRLASYWARRLGCCSASCLGQRSGMCSANYSVNYSGLRLAGYSDWSLVKHSASCWDWHWGSSSAKYWGSR